MPHLEALLEEAGPEVLADTRLNPKYRLVRWSAQVKVPDVQSQVLVHSAHHLARCCGCLARCCGAACISQLERK